ncbi:MAG: hypothetical protein SF051_08435 [Elusimicrobiota bacterium]|nr:hypothetical protein [Elusimicrobiota bacterium]
MSTSSSGRPIVRVIALVLAVYAAANGLWLWENGLRCVGSAYHARHFMRAAQFQVLLADDAPWGSVYRAMHTDRFYPAPLHSFTAAVALNAMDRVIPLVTGALNFVWFAAALAFLALLAVELGLSASVATWAVLLYALYPATFGLSRLYGAFDFQVASLMPLAAWALLRARGFQSRSSCLLLAGVVAAGLLIKDTFAGYFGPMFLLALHDAWRSRANRRVMAKNLLLAGALTGAIISVYYVHPVVLYKEATELLREPTGTRWLLDDWDAYTLRLSDCILSPPFLVLFLGALAWALRRRTKAFGDRLLLVWALAPWLIIMLMPHYKQPCYFSPILPAAALLSAGALHALAPKPRRAAMGVLLAAGVVQFAALSFGLGPELPRAWFKTDSTLVFHKGTPVELDPHQAVVEKLRALDARDRRDSRVLVLQGWGRQTDMSFYHFFNWLHKMDLEPAGGVAQLFHGRFLGEDYDKVLLPLPPGWDLQRWVRELHAESRALAERNWMVEDAAAVARTSPDSFAESMEAFLARYPAREELGRDEGSVFWLLTKAPPKRGAKPKKAAARS